MELTNEKKAEIANKLNFRQNLSKIEDAICEHPSSIREIFMPADQIITTKIHKKDHPFFVLSGKIIVISEKGKQEITGPYHGITRAGTKRLISVIEDCVFITVHATDKLTIETLMFFK